VHYLPSQPIRGRAKLTPAVKNKWSGGWVSIWFYSQVSLYKCESGSKEIHLLHSHMRNLNYLMEPPHNYVIDDMNVKAVELATKIIGGHEAVEELLACSILPLSDIWDLKVKKAKAPLS
jgi:hypothetical protein